MEFSDDSVRLFTLVVSRESLLSHLIQPAALIWTRQLVKSAQNLAKTLTRLFFFFKSLKWSKNVPNLVAKLATLIFDCNKSKSLLCDWVSVPLFTLSLFMSWTTHHETLSCPSLAFHFGLMERLTITHCSLVCASVNTLYMQWNTWNCKKSVKRRILIARPQAQRGAIVSSLAIRSHKSTLMTLKCSLFKTHTCS